VLAAAAAAEARSSAEAAHRAADAKAADSKPVEMTRDDSTVPSPFVAALRDALGIEEEASEEGAQRSEFAFGFDVAVETALKSLFLKCDTDHSGELGRAEFNHAMQALDLDNHLMLYGGDHGMVHGMQKLFVDLDTRGAGRLREEEFVALFKKLSEVEPKAIEPSLSRRGKETKSSLELHQEAQSGKLKRELSHVKHTLEEPLAGEPSRSKSSLQIKKTTGPTRGKSIHADAMMQASKSDQERQELHSTIRRVTSKGASEEPGSTLGATPVSPRLSAVGEDSIVMEGSVAPPLGQGASEESDAVSSQKSWLNAQMLGFGRNSPPV